MSGGTLAWGLGRLYRDKPRIVSECAGLAACDEMNVGKRRARLAAGIVTVRRNGKLDWLAGLVPECLGEIRGNIRPLRNP